MLYTIANERLRAQVDSLGAQLMSLRDSDGAQYIWDGNPKYWAARAIHLFPFAGRMTDSRYRVGAREYEMGIHGFAWTHEFSEVSCAGNYLRLRMRADAATRAMYPFEFLFSVCFTLDGAALMVRYEVENLGAGDMYFGVGGHPGLRVPIEAGRGFEEYRVRFEKGARPMRVNMTPDCFTGEGVTALPLDAQGALALRHGLFDDDAIILRDAGGSVRLEAAGGGRALRMDFPEEDYLGLWHMPHTDAPYLCIEPFSNLPSRKGVVEDWEQQEGIFRLEAGGVYSTGWSLRVE